MRCCARCTNACGVAEEVFDPWRWPPPFRVTNPVVADELVDITRPHADARESQHSQRRDRLRERSDAEDRVGRNWLAGGLICIAGPAEVHELTSSSDRQSKPRQPAL